MRGVDERPASGDQLVDDPRQQRRHRALAGPEQRMDLGALRHAAAVRVEEVVALDERDGRDVRRERGRREQAGDAATEDERGALSQGNREPDRRRGSDGRRIRAR